MDVNSLLGASGVLPLGSRKNTAIGAGLRVFLGVVVATGQAVGAGELFVLDECAVL